MRVCWSLKTNRNLAGQNSPSCRRFHSRSLHDASSPTNKSKPNSSGFFLQGGGRHIESAPARVTFRRHPNTPSRRQFNPNSGFSSLRKVCVFAVDAVNYTQKGRKI